MVESLPDARNPRSAIGMPQRLEAWSRAHALGVLAALIACAGFRAAWPLSLLAAPSFLWLAVVGRGVHTPSGRWGLANAVTALRLSLVMALIGAAPAIGHWGAVLGLSGALLLDGLDGRLARARGEASLFGAHFDMETDALLVLATTLRLWQVQGFGAWVLCAGLLRYGYVILLWFAPQVGSEAPRSRFGRHAFVISMSGLILGLALRGGWSLGFVVLGTLTVSASFARSLYYSRFGA